MAHSLAGQQFRSYQDITKWLDSWIASKDEHFYRNWHSTDLNPIESLWSILDRKVYKGEVINKKKLFEAYCKAWYDIDEQNIYNPVESMPWRLQAIIQAKDGHAKYYWDCALILRDIEEMA